MRDRPKSILPRPKLPRENRSKLPEENVGFHEVLLSLLEPEDRIAFRRVGTRLYELFLEVRPLASTESSTDDAFHEEVEAATVDLTTVRDVLYLLGEAIEESALGAEDARLSLVCRDIIEPLDTLIDQLQEAVK